MQKCHPQVADFMLRITKKYDCGIAVADHHFFEKLRDCNCGVFPSSCGIAIADLKKVAHAHLCSEYKYEYITSLILTINHLWATGNHLGEEFPPISSILY
jgi:hypothetical protein